MTDRHAGYIVTLGEDIRTDDAKEILTALRMVKGVSSVKPIVADVDLHIAEQRARLALQDKVWKALTEDG